MTESPVNGNDRTAATATKYDIQTDKYCNNNWTLFHLDG